MVIIFATKYIYFIIRLFRNLSILIKIKQNNILVSFYDKNINKI